MKKQFFALLFLLVIVSCGSVEQSVNDTDTIQNDADITDIDSGVDEDITDVDEDVQDVSDADSDSTILPIYKDVSSEEAHALIDASDDNPDFMIIDVRTESEYVSGHIDDAVNMNKYGDTFDADLEALDRNSVYLIYCASGARSAGVFSTMQSLDFQEVYNLKNGYSSWE